MVGVEVVEDSVGAKGRQLLFCMKSWVLWSRRRDK